MRKHPLLFEDLPSGFDKYVVDYCVHCGRLGDTFIEEHTEVEEWEYIKKKIEEGYIHIYLKTGGLWIPDKNKVTEEIGNAFWVLECDGEEVNITWQHVEV
jgi:hypothetical protein